MEITDIKVYHPEKHFCQVKQLMQEIQGNIERLRNRGVNFYLDESVLLASASSFENSGMLIQSYYPSNNGFLSLYLIPVVNADSKIGFVDRKCNVVIEPLYDEIKGTFFCKDNIVAVRQDEMWRVFDSNGKELLKKKYRIVPSKDSRMITVNSKIIQNVDEPLSRLYIKGGKDLSYVSGFRYGFARIHRNKLWGIINEKGEEVVPAIYSDMLDFYDFPFPTTKVKKSKDDNWEYIDLTKLK